VSPVIGFGVPIHESVEGATFAALAMTWAAWRDIAPDGWKLRIAPPRGCSVVENRNAAAAVLLRDGFTLGDRDVPGGDAALSPLSTRPADVIVWNDADCCVEPEQYVRLVESLLAAPGDVAAVAYAFPMQSGTERPRPNAGRSSGPLAFNAPGPVQLVEVDWFGFGVVATRAEVYRAMDEARWKRAAADIHERLDWTPGPWFQHVSGRGGRGEDIGWCRDVRALGYKLMVDVGVEGEHWYRAPHKLSDFYSQFHREG